MNPTLDCILAGVSHHGLTVHAELAQLMSHVIVTPTEIRVEPHLVGVALLVNIFSLSHQQTSQQREQATQS